MFANSVLMVEQARLFAESFHEAVANGTDAAFRDFLRNRVAVGFNPVMTTSKEEGGLGFDHAAVMRWAQAASKQVAVQLRTGSKKFKVGRLGSIWYDSNLAGDGKTKFTRVCLAPFRREQDGKFEVLLDATSDKKW